MAGVGIAALLIAPIIIAADTRSFVPMWAAIIFDIFVIGCIIRWIRK